MNTYQIADLMVTLRAHYETLVRQSQAYVTELSGPSDINIALNHEFLLQKQIENPHLTIDECEYIWTGAEFYSQLLDFYGLMLHASASAYEEKAYLFSAPCGTGKSTHARLWCEYFGANQVVIINDDKPAIRFIDHSFFVYGTPWSGKCDCNRNIKVPLQAICFLEQSNYNWIEKLDQLESLQLILAQTLRPCQRSLMNHLMDLLERLIQDIPVYKMGCNISQQAVVMAYQTMAAV